MRSKCVLAMLLVTLIWCGSAAGTGLTAWGLTEKDVGLDDNAIEARVGVRVGLLEVFLGSTWRPDFKPDADEEKPPQVMSLGGFYHFPDLIDPNNPMPIIPDVLLLAVPAGFEATPYIGAQFTANIVDMDSGFYGAAVGLLCKRSPADAVAIVIEGQYNRNFGELSAVPDKLAVFMGFHIAF